MEITTQAIENSISSLRLHGMILCAGIVFVLFIGHKDTYAQSFSGSFEFEGRNREYKVYLPQGFKANMPVVLCLHGWGENINWIEDYTLLHKVADTSGFIAAYPGSLPGLWNIGHPLTLDNSTVNDVGFISALLDTLHAQYNTDESRVYCCGFSMGGEFTYKLTGELGHRFAAVASVAGLLNESIVKTCKPVRPFPILHIHGTLDSYETWSGDKYNLLTVEETINFWLENNGCSMSGDTIILPDLNTVDGCRVEKISYTNCSGDGTLIFYKIPEGGHNWPGSTGWTQGNRNMDINASVEILNFFKQFDNPVVDMAHPKSLELFPSYISPSGDTLRVKAKLSNPENYPVDVFAVIQGGESAFIDTLQLFDDGLHGDGDSSDNIWSNIIWLEGLDKDIYEVNLFTHDHIYDNKLDFFWPARFTTIGPVVYEHYDLFRYLSNLVKGYLSSTHFGSTSQLLLP